jgi:hypothetical protein
VFGRISDFLAWLGGADRAVLAKVPSGRGRFTQMGGVLLTTAGIAVLSMTFALHDAVNVPWALAAVLGLLWGVVILNLDRLLVLSMGVVRGGRRMFLMALPRFLMAFVLAVVISTPLVLRIFASDINAQLFIMQQQTSAQQKKLEANSNEQHEANVLQGKITTDGNTLAGQLPVNVTNPALQTAQSHVTTLRQQENTQQKQANQAFEAYQCEENGAGSGCAGASSRAGRGPRYETDLREYQQDEQALQQTQSQLQSAKAALKTDQSQLSTSQKSTLQTDQAKARAELPGLQKQLNQLNAYLNSDAAKGTKANDADTGLLAQIQALFAASGKNAALALTHLFVFLLFFLIEILPVTVKLLMSMNKDTAYDIVARKSESRIIDAEKIDQAEARQIHEQKSQVRLQVEADMRRREIDLGKQANQYVATEMKKILDVALQQWGAQVTSQLQGAGQPQTAPPGPMAPGGPVVPGPRGMGNPLSLAPPAGGPPTTPVTAPTTPVTRPTTPVPPQAPPAPAAGPPMAPITVPTVPTVPHSNGNAVAGHVQTHLTVNLPDPGNL